MLITFLKVDDVWVVFCVMTNFLDIHIETQIPGRGTESWKVQNQTERHGSLRQPLLMLRTQQGCWRLEEINRNGTLVRTGWTLAYYLRVWSSSYDEQKPTETPILGLRLSMPLCTMGSEENHFCTSCTWESVLVLTVTRGIMQSLTNECKDMSYLINTTIG